LRPNTTKSLIDWTRGPSSGVWQPSTRADAPRMEAAIMGWSTLERPLDAKPPAPMTVRVQALPARSGFPDHTHEWGQVAYAISGVLAVYVPGQSFVISPKHAAWLPAGVAHRVGSPLGAEYRSLWVATEAVDIRMWSDAVRAANIRVE